MALSFSTSFNNQTPYRVFGDGFRSNDDRRFMQSTSGDNFITIHSGTRPSIATFKQQGTPIASRGDTLVYWQYPASTFYGNNATNANSRTSDTFTIPGAQLADKLATNAGVATWFSFVRSLNSKYYGVATGTVGLVGSGADLEIEDVNIVVNNNILYGIPSGLDFKMPIG